MGRRNVVTLRPSDEVGRLASWSVVTGSQDPFYPIDYINSFVPVNQARPFMFTGPFGTVAATYATKQVIKYAVIWSNASFDLPVIFSAGAVSKEGRTPLVRADGFHDKIVIDLGSVPGYDPTGYTSFSIEIPSPGNNGGVPFGMKVLLYTDALVFDKGWAYGFHKGRIHSNSVHQTTHKIRWSYDLFAAQTPLSGRLILSENDVAALERWFDDNRGIKISSIWFDPDHSNIVLTGWMMPQPSVAPAVPSGPTDFVLDITREPDAFRGLYTADIGLIEMTAGLPEWD